MLIYATRGVPWPRVTTAAALVVVLIELVRWNPWTLWPLEGTAVGLLSGATAWCFDETAAAVVEPGAKDGELLVLYSRYSAAYDGTVVELRAPLSPQSPASAVVDAASLAARASIS